MASGLRRASVWLRLVVRIALVERIGVGKQGEHVDHVVFGLAFDRHVLMRQRVVQRVAEEFLQTRNRLDGHRAPPIDRHLIGA